MNRRSARNHLLLFILVFMLILTSAFSLPETAQAAPIAPPEEFERVEAEIQTGSAGIATGDPYGEHSVYGWPFAVSQVGHINSSYQLYSSYPDEAYFHHGIDLLANYGTQVRTPTAGQVVNVENYSSPSNLYWEVAILDTEGYVWQYHHIEQTSIPQAIHYAYQDYLADHENGGFIPADTYLGKIVKWPVSSFGYYFHHIHLNILAAGDFYLNPIEFLDNSSHPDTQAPQIQGVGLFTGTNTLLSENTIPYGTDYSIYLRARDLYKSQVYYLPPHRITYKLDGSSEVHTVWDFHTLPGGSSNTAYVNSYFLPGHTRGNYQARDFYINMGFSKNGINPLPTDPGIHTIDITVYDYAGNSAVWRYVWTITQELPRIFLPLILADGLP